MNFLLTNDDGFDAPGIATLRAVLSKFGRVITVAPAEEHSGCGHRFTAFSEISVEGQGEDHYVVAGTPVDCTRVGLFKFGEEIDWVVAGINQGGNLGTDVFASGTVAAVREAALRGKPGIAISQFHNQTGLEWNRSSSHAEFILQELFSRPIPESGFWNVNLPAFHVENPRPTFVDCPLDVTPLALEFQEQASLYRFVGSYQNRPRASDHDVDVCFRGEISVTLLKP